MRSHPRARAGDPEPGRNRLAIRERLTKETFACGRLNASDMTYTKGNRHMARLQGVDLPREKRLEVALTYVYGIGRTRAAETLAATGISGDIRVKDLTDEMLVALRDHIDANYEVEGDLRRTVAADIRRKIEIGTYQGRRHRSGLPVRGQRTRTNARTRKGKKKAVAGKKKAR